MTDLIEKMLIENRTYYETGGDDWGYVYVAAIGEQVSEDFDNYDDAMRAAKTMNMKAAASILLREMMEPSEEMLKEQYHGPVVSWKKTLAAFAKSHSINIEEISNE